MTKESPPTPKPPKPEKKKLTKEEKKEEKRKKKEMMKSKESLDMIDDGSATPKSKRKEKKPVSPGRDSQCSTGSKKKGLFKRIGSFMLPAAALTPASPNAQEGVITSQSCQNLAMSPPSSRTGLSANSISSPNLYPPFSPPPPTPSPQHPTPVLNSHFPARARMQEEPNSFLADNDDSFQSDDYKVIVVNLTRDDDNTITCAINKKIEGKSHVTQRETDGLLGNHVGTRVENNELSYVVSEVGEVCDDYEMTELKVEAVEVHKVASNPIEQLGGDMSVEYSLPVKQLDFDMTPRSLNPFSSDEEEDESSPRRSSILVTPGPSPRKEKRISFAGAVDKVFRVVTPEILKRDLAATLGMPTPPNSRDVIDLPELSNMDGLSPEERFSVYEEKILQFRDQALKIVSENSRLKKLVSEQSAQDVETVQKQAQQVLQENRILIKEQQMNEARWQELIEERNQEVLRMRATCSNMEDQNTTLLKRCEKLEGRNEELREAYNSIVTQADDFVPVSAHLSSVEGYKVALEELRKRYDDNVHDKEDEMEGLEKTVAQLSERVEVLEEDKSLLVGQCKGLKGALEKAQHSSTRHKREAVQLTQRINTLKVSLAQAINIAEQSTLHKLELAEILQISDLQEKQKRSTHKHSTDTRVKEVKKIANAKLKSCAEILQEREEEHDRSISKLNDRITKLKMRCHNKDDMIHNLTNSDRTHSPESA
ncbi:uncharacterized protein LOC134826574 isoform X2 [Bolinopsis microptera]|uniref:uncharacterized protein LOC134826574 isoform X2 n=1 Tax=Bolinopsis microptera TaxID=2820187 RepID=UPI003079A7FC